MGQNGFFLKTDDGGRTWKNGSIKTGEDLYKIFMRGDYGVIVGDHGVMIKTNDGGATWLTGVAPNLRLPFPWLADAWIITNARSAKIIAIGKGVIIKAGFLPER